MTTATIVKTLIDILIVALVGYGLINEKKLIRFERNFVKVVKACVAEIRRKDTAEVKQTSAKIVELHNDDIAVIATQHERKSKIIDIRIA